MGHEGAHGITRNSCHMVVSKYFNKLSNPIYSTLHFQEGSQLVNHRASVFELPRMLSGRTSFFGVPDAGKKPLQLGLRL